MTRDKKYKKSKELIIGERVSIYFGDAEDDIRPFVAKICKEENRNLSNMVITLFKQERERREAK